MKMNQSLRDFSDRHFEVVFVSGPYCKIGQHRERLGRFKHYADASAFQKDTCYALQWSTLEQRTGFPPGQYIKLYSVPKPWNDPQWEQIVHYVPDTRR